jgi:hypothetical protein
VFLYVSLFVCLCVYLSYCPFVCFFVCCYIYCTGNMFLLIPTQVQLQTGIQVSYCIISLCFCICLFVYLSICMLLHQQHRQHVSLNSDTSPTSDRHSSNVFVCFFVSFLCFWYVFCLFVCLFV